VIARPGKGLVRRPKAPPRPGNGPRSDPVDLPRSEKRAQGPTRYPTCTSVTVSASTMATMRLMSKLKVHCIGYGPSAVGEMRTR
jgi:hypothetical protein